MDQRRRHHPSPLALTAFEYEETWLLENNLQPAETAERQLLERWPLFGYL